MAMPSQKQIIEYWYKKDRFYFIEYEEEKKQEDHCWACDKETTRLERCHVIAKSLGGSDDVSNLVLMCKNCHKESPDTILPNVFWRWFWHKRETTVLGISIPVLFSYVNPIIKKVQDGSLSETVLYEILDILNSNGKHLFTYQSNRSSTETFSDYMTLLNHAVDVGRGAFVKEVHGVISKLEE